ADGVRFVVGVVRRPGVIAQLLRVVAERVRRRRAGAAGPLPLGLGRQAVGLAGLDRQPAGVLHGAVVRDADDGGLPAGEADRLVGVGRRGAGDGVGVLGLLGLLVLLLAGPAAPPGVEFVPGHLELADPHALDRDGVLRPLVLAAALLVLG